MQAKIIKSFRIAEGQGSRKYTPGDVAEGHAAEWAVEHGYGVEIGEKAMQAPTNKAHEAAPENRVKRAYNRKQK